MNTRTRTTRDDAAILGLGSVLVGSLPASLLTADAPDRYTVEAVFTRKPEPEEVAQILGASTAAFLADGGYPEVVLTVSDRRLEIAGTTLEQLRDGLAGLLAERLAAISSEVHARRDAEAARFHEAAAREGERAAAVAALAESVVFRTHDRHTTGADRTQISGWEGEGGHGR